MFQLVAQIPWGHHRLILDKLTDPPARLYYLKATAQFDWSRAVLLNQIKAQAYERAKAEKKTHNFAMAVPEHFAEQAIFPSRIGWGGSSGFRRQRAATSTFLAYGFGPNRGRPAAPAAQIVFT